MEGPWRIILHHHTHLQLGQRHKMTRCNGDCRKNEQRDTWLWACLAEEW